MYAHEKSANLVKIYLQASVTKRDKGWVGGASKRVQISVMYFVDCHA